ncbi:MAG: glycosyltransferase [Pseudomonadota bacterium]
MRIQVLGIIRFSYPSVFNQLGAEDFEAYRRELYEPHRMAKRLVWLSHVVLPSLAQQTDQDFTCVLLIGDRMPQSYRDDLEMLVAPLPQIKIVAEPEGQVHRFAIRDVMARFSDQTADYVAEFLMDDDDAVGRSFVATSRSCFPQFEQLMPHRERVTLDFCHGYLLQMDGAGHRLKPIWQRMWAPGLVSYRKPNRSTALRFIVHNDIWRNMPCVSLNQKYMFVRGVHEFNVSNMANRWDRHPDVSEDGEDHPALMKEHFGIDLEAFQRDRTALGP